MGRRDFERETCVKMKYVCVLDYRWFDKFEDFIKHMETNYPDFDDMALITSWVEIDEVKLEEENPIMYNFLKVKNEKL